MQCEIVYFAASAAFGITFSVQPSIYGLASIFAVLIYTGVKRRYQTVLAILAGFCFFYVYTAYYETHNVSMLQKGKIRSYGEFVDEPRVDGDSVKAVIKHENGESVAMIYKAKDINDQELFKNRYGGVSCLFEGELKEPKKAVNPNGFDYKSYLHQNRIYWIFVAERIGHCSAPKSPLAFLHLLRMEGNRHIEKVFPQQSAGLVQALLLGERSQMDQDTLDSYQNLGTIHLLAISGMQVGLLAALCYNLLLLIGLTHEKARIVLLFLLPAYGVITGESDSVMRAVYMAELFLLTKSLKFPLQPLHIIAYSFLFMLVLNPLQLFQPGFQLSFLVSLSLMLSSKFLSGQSFFIQTLSISALSQICSLPVILPFFYQISLMSFFINLFYVPYYSFVLFPLALAGFILSSLPGGIGNLPVSLFNTLIQWTDNLTEAIASHDPFLLLLGKPPDWLEVLYIISALFLCLSFEYKLKGLKRLLPYGGMGILLILHSILPYLSPYGEVTFLDIGQGDSIFIELPYRQGIYMIDTGGKVTFENKEKWRERKNTASLAKSVTLPFLKSKGISKIDTLFLTHGDMDHVGEAQTLLNEVQIDQLAVPKGFIRDKTDETIIQAALQKKVEISAVQKGDVFYQKSYPFYILSPAEWSESKNDSSIVIYAKIGGKSWLFTGDLEKEGERKLLQNYPDLHADILKAGHHGSKGSSSDEFLDALKPKTAVISAGKNNRYHHPHKEVLDKLKVRGISIYRTDLQGAIQYQFSGSIGTFLTYPPYDEVWKDSNEQ
ncbi:DNA internalization-related competence protein ComEC/Rec2 [Metabacillus sp. RGM 3146]|uniref:DNA internalization-related competence protein ComEC/Rec2 n=1 Tax=Metabacillus sp. RGM 3146 TaxID=3401092 RepID=UPI003B9BAE66